MKVKNLNLVWGIALIVAGGLFLAQNLGIFPVLTSLVWVVFFAGLSLVFFACYFLAGLSQWGWLFPALISGALALTVGLGTAGSPRLVCGRADPGGGGDPVLRGLRPGTKAQLVGVDPGLGHVGHYCSDAYRGYRPG